MNNHVNLLKYAEETAYSSKGHFKTADYIKISLGLYISVPIIISIFLIIYPEAPQLVIKLLSFFSIAFSILALTSPQVSNQDQGRLEIEKHMELGTSYLFLYKEIRSVIASDKITDDYISRVAESISKLDSESATFQIGIIGRLWSRVRIKKEMDLSWLEL